MTKEQSSLNSDSMGIANTEKNKTKKNRLGLDTSFPEWSLFILDDKLYRCLSPNQIRTSLLGRTSYRKIGNLHWLDQSNRKREQKIIMRTSTPSVYAPLRYTGQLIILERASTPCPYYETLCNCPVSIHFSSARHHSPFSSFGAFAIRLQHAICTNLFCFSKWNKIIRRLNLTKTLWNASTVLR